MTESESSFPQYKFDLLDQFINKLPDRRGALIGTLHRAQELFGYLPQEVQLFVARNLGIPVAKVYGVVSFYSFFTMEPRGEFNISICMGTACFVQGADKILNEFETQLKISTGETTQDGLFSISPVRCIGACGLAPVVMVNSKVYGRVKKDEVSQILAEYDNKEVTHG